MASDPLDQLQSMFPTIEGDVIAIVFSESDKDVPSTVEKLLQLVPNESEREFPSLMSTVQRSQLPPPSHQVQLLNFQPEISASGLVSVNNHGLVDQPLSKFSSNSSWQNHQQRVNRRLQGPTHIPPATKKRQHGQTNLGKGTAPGNQKRAGGYSSDNVSLNGQTTHPQQQQQQQQQVQGRFYQMGGSSAVNSMPALSSFEPSYYYHQAPLLPQQPQQQQQQQQQLHHQYQLQPQSHSHSQFQSQYRSQQQRHGTAYPGMKPNDPFLANWLNSPGQSDHTNVKKSPFHNGQQPLGRQNWPNIGANGNVSNLQQYQQQQEHVIKTQNPTLPPYGGSSEGFPVHTLLGNQSDQNHGSGWLMYSTGGGGGSEERGKMDTVSALIQPERSPLSGLIRYGHIESEPSSSKPSTDGHHGRSVGGAPGNKVDAHGKKAVAHAGSRVDRTTSGTIDERRWEKSSGVKSDRGPRKLIILRGLPGSGKTTLARSLVGTDGVVCCTDDFFVKSGEYVFDPSLLEENHHRNQCKAGDAMKKGCSPVIIDNTNTNAWEMKPYVLLAMEHGYAVEILEPDTPWRFKTAELARRNSHGVPRSSLEKMLERYDHRVTLESIIVSQQPERKPAPSNLEPSRSSSGGQSTNTGGQKGGGRTTKVPPTTPRQQQGGGASNADHTHSVTHQKQQTRSGQLSPRPRRGGQRSNDSGGRVSPRPASQRGQRSAKDSGASAAISRNGNEGRPSGDVRKKTTPISSNQHQGTRHGNTTQNEQFSRGKGKRTTTHLQQAGNKSALSTTTASNKKRSVSPSSRGKTSSKQNSQTVGGKVNGHHCHPTDKDVGSDHVQESSAENSKRSSKGAEEDVDDEFLWDSSEELEILEASSSEDDDAAVDRVVGGEEGGPVFMTDDPPKDAFFRPIPQFGRPLMNGVVGAVNGGCSVVEGGEGGHNVPMFEVWKDSDDDDIDDVDDRERGREECEETALPVVLTSSGGQGSQSETSKQVLQRTAEVANIGELLCSTKVGVVNISPSHPWERTQSARDLQSAADNYNSLMRRVQSADPSRGLSVLSEAEGSQAVADVCCDEGFNVFTMSSVWGSQSGLLSSKMELFDGDLNSKSHVDRIDSTVKSFSSLQSTDSSDSQVESKKKAQSFYSMLDALTEEMSATAVDKMRKDEDGSIDESKMEGVDSLVKRPTMMMKWKLLEEAVQSAQGSSTIEEAAKDEAKYPLRSMLIEGLLTESTSVSEENGRTLQSLIEEANDVLEMKVDVVTLVPDYLSLPDLDGGSLPPPVKDDPSFAHDEDKHLEGGMVSFLADFSFEQGCSLEALTDKIFMEEQLFDEQSFSKLQAALQTIVQTTVLEQRSSLFSIDGDVEPGSERVEKRDESGHSMFEDPAVLSKVRLERGGSDTEEQLAPEVVESSAPGVTLQELPVNESESKPVRGRDASKFLSLSSPKQFEPLDVFPSAFEEGAGASFPLGVVSNEGADRSRSTSREQTASLSEPNSSSLHSQTPVNDYTEPEISSADTEDGISYGCGLEEEVTFEPISTETGKLVDEVTSAEDSALIFTTSEPSLEGYYLNLGATSRADGLSTSNSESDLLFLVECFPDLEPNYLSMILTMSKGSVEGAIGMIVVSHSSSFEGGPTDQNFMHFDSHISMETTDDTSSTISSASCSEIYPRGFSGQLLDSSSEQGTAPSRSHIDHMHAQEERHRATFSIGGGEDDEEGDVQERALVPFFDEPQCVNDEEIARALQEELNLEAASNENMNGEASTSTGDHVEMLDQSSSHRSGVGCEARPTEGENLELKLSASLAKQLQDMFGPVSDKLPFKSEIGEEDLVVLLSERAAREIYKKWLDTLHAKRIGYRVQSEIELTRDEALARRLQEEEDSRGAAGTAGGEGGKKLRRKGRQKFRHFTEPDPLAVMAADNCRVHHNSSPPQLGTLEGSPQTGGGLVDIMGEQMAQQIQEAEVAQVVKEKARPNLSLKLQLKELYCQFPSLEQPLVNETLVRNKFDLDATETELKQIVLAPPPAPPPSSSSAIQRETVDGRGMTRSNKPFKSGVHGPRSPAKRKLFKGEEKEPTTNERVGDYRALDEDERQALYIELRAEAALHAKLRAESFMKAAHARGKKQYDVAQYYAQQGHLHTEKMKEANQRAAEATLEHNFTSSAELDLHGLHVDEAIVALEKKLTSCKDSKLRVVTGQGIHSKGGKGARIRPAVVSYLQNKQYKFMFEERNPGVLTIKVK